MAVPHRSRIAWPITRRRAALVVLLLLTSTTAAACGSDADPGGLNDGSSSPRAATSSVSEGTYVVDGFERTDGELGVTDTGQAWSTDPQSTWAVEDGRAALLDAPVNARAEAVVDAGVADEVVLRAEITLSPTLLRGNAGVVFRFADHANYLWAKIEVSEGHPDGFMSIGKLSDGETFSLLASRDAIGLRNGGTYLLAVKISGDLVTLAVSGAELERPRRISYRLDPEETARYGPNTWYGLRGRLAMDEDDGGSRWDAFSVTALGRP